MDYHQESVFPSGNDVKPLARNSGNSGSNNAPMKFDIGLPQSASGEEPPVKKSRSSAMEEACRKRAIAKMLYKTKLCSRFRSGPCVADCWFAHGKEELRKPPPNWKETVAAREEELRKPPLNRKEIVAAQEEDEAVSVEPEDRCTFVHDEQAKARGSDAITIAGNMPLYCETRVCSKWEMMGYCPFQNRCHFAHGVEESATTPTEAKQDVLPPETPTEAVVGAAGGEKRSRKEKIREIISILQSMIPGGKDKDVVEVIDEAIEYLQSLKVTAKDLGFDTLQPSLKTNANGNIYDRSFS